jgi:hypothetical protein
MKKLIRKILTGNTAIREYATVTVTNNIVERAYLKVNKTVVDVSPNQWVLCLKPLVFGIWIKDKKLSTVLNKKSRGTLIFEDALSNKKKVAITQLDVANKIEEDEGTLFLLQLKHCRLYHLNFFKTHFLFNRYYKKPGLSFNKYKSLVAAYSYPRKVRIISFKSNNHYNIFPMDLVGEMKTNNRMVFGLRHTNRTLSMIIETKKIVASEAPFVYKEIIYKLGSHHGTAPPLVQELPFKVIESTVFGFHVPEWVESYKEIQILETLNAGSHMVLWGEVINEVVLKPATSSLYHVHFMHYLHQKRKGLEYPLA